MTEPKDATADVTLLGCPFCGSEIIGFTRENKYECARQCLNCEATDPLHRTNNAAIAAWNQRVAGEQAKRDAETDYDKMVGAVRVWAEHHMDQWEKFKYDWEFGTIYVTISMNDPYPDSFDKVPTS